jgi:hypothetical protein
MSMEEMIVHDKKQERKFITRKRRRAKKTRILMYLRSYFLVGK